MYECVCTSLVVEAIQSKGHSIEECTCKVQRLLNIINYPFCPIRLHCSRDITGCISRC